MKVVIIIFLALIALYGVIKFLKVQKKDTKKVEEPKVEEPKPTECLHQPQESVAAEETKETPAETEKPKKANPKKEGGKKPVAAKKDKPATEGTEAKPKKKKPAAKKSEPKDK